MSEAGLLAETPPPEAGEGPPCEPPGTFVEALAEHQSLVFSLAFHMLRNAALAEDVAQEVFLRLYRDFDRIGERAHLVHWLRRTTTHRCLDLLRRSARRRQVVLDEAEIAAPRAQQHDPLLARTLRRLVAQLPPIARATVVLRYQEDLDPRDIAQVLGLPVNTVKSRLQRALVLLRRRLVDIEESP